MLPIEIMPDARIYVTQHFTPADGWGQRDACFYTYEWRGGKIGEIDCEYVHNEMPETKSYKPGDTIQLGSLRLIIIGNHWVRDGFFVTRKRRDYLWIINRIRASVFLIKLKNRIIGTCHVWGLASYHDNPNVGT